MALRELRLHEPFWEAATPLRRMEWRTAIEDLVAEGRFHERIDGTYVLVIPGTSEFVLEFLDEEGEVLERTTIHLDTVAPSIAEYVDVIRRLDQVDQDGVRRDLTHIESLDMAKKVVHDKAARELSRAQPDLALDLATYRRLFTLLFTAHVDTTRMVHARGHRLSR
jgi:uncharacterized protein (UPF0262 family)